MAVTLHTSHGDLKLELHCREAPKTCKNFLALCASDFYNGLTFHRNIKGFLVQGGDPTGDGKGGESIYGALFENEIVGHLKHDRRGVVSMANLGKPGTNGSQFFITYAKHPQLNGAYTVFGSCGASVPPPVDEIHGVRDKRRQQRQEHHPEVPPEVVDHHVKVGAARSQPVVQERDVGDGQLVALLAQLAPQRPHVVDPHGAGAEPQRQVLLVVAEAHGAARVLPDGDALHEDKLVAAGGEAPHAQDRLRRAARLPLDGQELVVAVVALGVDEPREPEAHAALALGQHLGGVDLVDDELVARDGEGDAAVVADVAVADFLFVALVLRHLDGDVALAREHAEIPRAVGVGVEVGLVGQAPLVVRGVAAPATTAAHRDSPRFS
ncbi:cyclophilin, putative [Babesia caballi]|uniref:Cyclophilin, putative n=1 Tax=Babesia caballi TaxID=5871 RepID=A0AAV4LYP5_BABCB|nr:cyclophilin, putative [Babesia caballi]